MSEKNIYILFKLFHKVQMEGRFPSPFYKASITLTPKADKNTTQMENHIPMSLMNINAKILNKY